MNNNNNVHPIFGEILNSITNTQKPTVNPLTKRAIRCHTDDFMTGKYPCLHMSEENESTYVFGYLRGMDDALETWEKEIVKMEEKIKAVTAKYNALLNSTTQN